VSANRYAAGWENPATQDLGDNRLGLGQEQPAPFVTLEIAPLEPDLVGLVRAEPPRWRERLHPRSTRRLGRGRTR
jgi:hypothetical protein